MNRVLFSALSIKVAFYQLLALLSVFWSFIHSLSAAELTLTPSADTSFHESAPNNNMGGNAFVSGGSNGSLSPVRALFQFDLAGIPSGSTIVSVKLQLSVTGVPFILPANSTFGLHRLNQSWG